ncbi:ribonucleoside hydrolase 1 [Mesorhizobium plurifarium]|uniref:Ribonucleoside hydrolase 1 n=1 Tax=Mesorhizobium plurifarium TaxID=69974 RepID=A0A090G5D0_MESPL|nr:ribonucleoside hydrolase 1 [Mesorhizobium plurifarium]
MTKPIILDCDPGNDDALGILVAAGHEALDLKAVTTGAGHLAGDRTARNGAIAVAFTGRGDVPVAAGAMGPLVRERLIAGILDQTSALDPERPDLEAVALDPRHSSDLIAELVVSGVASTVVTTGPLTNLALALRRNPGLPQKIERVVSLGGAWGLGNKTAAAEWNVLCDPEAAAIVFGAGIPLTLVPIDVGPQAVITDRLISDTEAIGGRVGRFAAELLRSLNKTFRPGVFGPAAMPLNDPVASLVAAEPSLAKTVPARLEVELAGRLTYGRTVIDFAGRSGAPNAEIAVELDGEGIHAAFIAALKRLASRPDRTGEEI